MNSLNQLYISYGSLVPRTKWGKIVTMIYAVCGIPVYILYFMNMGKVSRLLNTCPKKTEIIDL